MSCFGATASAFKRSVYDLAEDSKATAKNWEAGNFDEWPNEAGLEALTEERGPVKLLTIGDIPAWAAGSLYRTGPGVYSIDVDDSGRSYDVQHWFDGLGHVHRFEIVAPKSSDSSESTSVWYSSRRQCDDFIAQVRAGATQGFSFAQRKDPCIGLFGKIMSSFSRKMVTTKNLQVTVSPDVGVYAQDSVKPLIDTVTGHTANVKSLWAATDNAYMRQIDPITLEPSPKCLTLGDIGTEFAYHSSCAHAGRDPKTGDYFNYGLKFGRVPTYSIYQLHEGDSKPRVIANIQGSGVAAAYMHSCFLSPSYFILCIPSSHLAWNGLKLLWNLNIIDTILPFNESQKCRWFVVDRHHGRGVVGRFETPAGFFFHSVNAFEDNEGHLFCEMVEYPNTDIMSSFYCNVMLDKNDSGKTFWKSFASKPGNMGALRRYQFDINAAPASGLGPAPKLVVDIPAPHVGELPTINPAYATKKHRYVYSVVTRGLSTMYDAIAKTDTVSGNVIIWSGEKGHTPGEPIFVANPESENKNAAEDNGVLLSVVLDGGNRKSYLLCLDACTMQERGRAECEFAVGLGFHGHHAKAKH
ncbi:hypothetical protein Cpir12675_000167 [Ceratocystis pirilliformis]|uniref:Uncharacterized protein n=1 Tax=Ceratocystis pirilliformis TaxID=259994 RepID=A0ABR3ZMY7_9PEZI